MAVKAKGPVPAFCADCRRKRSRNGHNRPKVVNCERCGNEITVRARGPLPRFCRDGCVAEPAASAPRASRKAAPSASGPGVAVAVQPATALRPWDRTERPKTDKRPAKAAKPDDKPKTESPTDPAPAFTPTVTRMDTVHPATIVKNDLIGRTVRVRRFRQAAAIAAWLAIIAIVVLILFVGSKPAPPDFESAMRIIA